MQFSHGNPTDLATLTAVLNEAATAFAAVVIIGDATHGDVECFAVTMAPGTAGAFAKLHSLRGQLKAAGYSVRSNLCGSTPSVLVRKSQPVATYEPADVDLTACDCGGDCAHELADFESFATCRCCCSCGAPDSVVFDVHAKTDDDSDVEPHCHGCTVEAVDKMLADGWSRDSFELRPLPMSDRALRLAVAA